MAWGKNRNASGVAFFLWNKRFIGPGKQIVLMKPPKEEDGHGVTSKTEVMLLMQILIYETLIQISSAPRKWKMFFLFPQKWSCQLLCLSSVPPKDQIIIKQPSWLWYYLISVLGKQMRGETAFLFRTLLTKLTN